MKYIWRLIYTIKDFLYLSEDNNYHGVSKSHLSKRHARENGLPYIDLTISRKDQVIDFVGIPFIEK